MLHFQSWWLVVDHSHMELVDRIVVDQPEDMLAVVAEAYMVAAVVQNVAVVVVVDIGLALADNWLIEP